MNHLAVVLAMLMAGQGRPPGWTETLDKTLQMTIDGKHAEVALGRSLITSGAAGARSTGMKHLETAAAHGRRAFELGGESPKRRTGPER